VRLSRSIHIKLTFSSYKQCRSKEASLNWFTENVINDYKEKRLRQMKKARSPSMAATPRLSVPTFARPRSDTAESEDALAETETASDQQPSINAASVNSTTGKTVSPDEAARTIKVRNLLRHFVTSKRKTHTQEEKISASAVMRVRNIVEYTDDELMQHMAESKGEEYAAEVMQQFAVSAMILKSLCLS
jgi:hypothetical protein